MYCPLNITQHKTIIFQITGNKNKYTLIEHVKTVSKVSIFSRSTIFILNCLNPPGHGIHQSCTGCCWHPVSLLHNDITDVRMLDTWCFSTFRLRMPHMCSIGFRSGVILGHSITFTFSSKAVVILAVCLLGGKTVSEGRASSSVSECHSTYWNPCFPQLTVAPQYQQ